MFYVVPTIVHSKAVVLTLGSRFYALEINKRSVQQLEQISTSMHDLMFFSQVHKASQNLFQKGEIIQVNNCLKP